MVEILDCTIRDGGYLNNWFFEDNLVRELYRSISKSGVDFIEIGFKANKAHFKNIDYGPWRFTEDAKLKQVIENIQGKKISVMINFKEFDISLLKQKEDSLIELIRIAVHKNNVKEALNLSEDVKNKGYKTSIQLMGYSTYSESEQEKVVDLLEKYQVDYAYIADSYGSILPFQISKLFKPLLEISSLKIGFHPHNNLQMGLANALEAINSGVDIIDGTVYGMGRGAGNLPIESLISYLQIGGSEKYNVIPILHLIDKYFVELHEEYKWGHQLPYMLSGLFGCHPYYPKRLVELHEYTIEDIWKALEGIKSLNPIGFDESILERLIKYGFIGTDEISIKSPINQKTFSVNCKPNYINRYENNDFLILANGPNLKIYKNKIDNFIKKYNPIILGANFLDDLFIPDYHAFNNKRRFQDYIATANIKSKLLLGCNFKEDFIKKYTSREYEYLCFTNTLTDFDIQDGVILSNCKTISVLLLGLAIVMGAKRIFVVGLDGYINKDAVNKVHFYNEKDDPDDFEIFVQKHQWNEHFLEQINNYLVNRNKEGIHILTPTGFKKYYNSIENYI